MSDERQSLPGPFDIPAAWRGAELLTRTDWSYEFTAEDIAEIDNALAVTEVDEFHFPKFGNRLRQIQHDLEHGSGACLLRGFPIDRYDEDQARRLFLGMARYIGTPVTQSAAGETIFSVRDEGFQIGQPQARGPNTRKRLSFHTDRCDVIAFLCLRQARSGGENQIVSSVALFNEMRRLRPDLTAVLMQPFYYQRHNVDTANQKPWIQQPIFSCHQGFFAASFLRVLIERAYAMPELPDMTATQREAMDFLEELANRPELHVTFCQEPGDILFLNNWVTFHRRNEFEDYEDPALRRHLLRIWLAVPNSRPLAPEFAANYGSTTAGAIRGGMPASN